ncbi:MAG: 2-C-methyl-D-erythritol 2,4-cyclodiphosphate synthase [Desulfatirhabdiaceae bacterium]
MRVGIGYDVHRLVPGRELILGGVTIPFEKGLLGHSDADVLIHAVCDALLGAAGMGDIGEHFPDSDARYKNVCSLNLLKSTTTIVKQKGFRVVNIDATIVAQAPRLSGFRQKMREKIAETVAIPFEAVNIKATTTEGLGIIGREEAMSAMSVAMIEPGVS